MYKKMPIPHFYQITLAMACHWCHFECLIVLSSQATKGVSGVSDRRGLQVWAQADGKGSDGGSAAAPLTESCQSPPFTPSTFAFCCRRDTSILLLNVRNYITTATLCCEESNTLCWPDCWSHQSDLRGSSGEPLRDLWGNSCKPSSTWHSFTWK